MSKPSLIRYSTILVVLKYASALGFSMNRTLFGVMKAKSSAKKLMLEIDDDHQRLSPTDLNQKLEKKMKERMISVATAIEAHYKRSEVLLEAITKAPFTTGQPTLVYHVGKSRVDWMKSQKFKDGPSCPAVGRRRPRGTQANRQC